MISRKRISLLLLLVFISGAAAYVPIKNAVLAARLMIAVRRLANGSTAETLPVKMEKIIRPFASRDLEALVYRPSWIAPRRSLVLVAGISELGCYHPRLMAISRTLASLGWLVVTPDIQSFRKFRIAPEALEEIAFWVDQVNALPGGGESRQVGLGGISFSGTLALIASTRPELRGRVAYILAIGPYDDPLRCAQAWFAAGPVTVGPGYYPTRFYAKWIIMLAALDLLPAEEERRHLSEVLTALLLQKQVPAPIRGLSPQALRWRELALMREDQTDPELSKRIHEHLALNFYRLLTPDRAAPEVRCPVFLVHGAYDDLIPPDESRHLKARLTKTKTYLLVSPFLTHTHPLEQPISWRERIRGVLDISAFFYRYARTVA